MKSPLSYQARCELVEHMAPQYREASRAQKILLLDTFVVMTGYVRKYAMWLLISSRRIKAEHPACASRSLWSRNPGSPVLGMERSQSDLC